MMRQNNTAVIMCVYNGDDPTHLHDAITSILNQTVSVDLYVFQDGPVNESILTVFNHFQGQFIILKSTINVGLACGLNQLIDIVVTKEYEYIARMDADDVSYKDRIERQINFLDEHNEVHLLGTSCREFGSSFSLDVKHLPTMHNELLNFSISRCPLIHPTVMFRISVFKSGYRYPTDTSFTEDMALWFILLASGHHFANINDVLLDYRLNEDTVKRRRGFKKSFSEFKVRFKYMFVLRKVSFWNLFLVTTRLFFHMLPPRLIALCYKHLR